MACIYKITNKINNKSYIGFTSQPIKNRLKQHQYKSSKCPAISSAIQKYGWDSFEWSILKESKNKQYLLNIVEPQMIKKYKPEYNMTFGGEGTFGNIIPGKRAKGKRAVIQYDMEGNRIKKWCSAKVAGKTLNILPSSITHVCKKDHKSNCAGGFQWRYAVENIQSLPPVIRKFGKRQVIEIITNRLFNSVTSASLYANVSKSAMVKYCKDENGWKYYP